MRKGSNQQNCGSIVGRYESLGLNTEQTKVSSQSLTPPGFVVRHKLSFFGHTIRDGGCELVKCVIQGKVSGKRRRGRPKTSYSSNITKWISESMERITWDTRGIVLDGEDWYDVRHGRLIIIPNVMGSRKKNIVRTHVITYTHVVYTHSHTDTQIMQCKCWQ